MLVYFLLLLFLNQILHNHQSLLSLLRIGLFPPEWAVAHSLRKRLWPAILRWPDGLVYCLFLVSLLFSVMGFCVVFFLSHIVGYPRGGDKLHYYYPLHLFVVYLRYFPFCCWTMVVVVVVVKVQQQPREAQLTLNILAHTRAY